MIFRIKIKVDNRIYRLSVERIFIDERIERYLIKGRDRNVVVESNRPLFRNRGLKHRKPDWKIIEGQVQDNHAFKAAIQIIIQEMDKKNA